MLTPLLKALIPFVREMFFGKEDPLEVLERNKTSSVLVLTVMLLSVVIFSLIYSYVKLYSDNVKLKQGIIPTVAEVVVSTPSATDLLILDRLQTIELKLMEVRTTCSSKTTATANNTVQHCP